MPEALGEGAWRRAAEGERAEGLAGVGAPRLEAGHRGGGQDGMLLGRGAAPLVPVTHLLELPNRVAQVSLAARDGCGGQHESLEVVGAR